MACGKPALLWVYPGGWYCADCLDATDHNGGSGEEVGRSPEHPSSERPSYEGGYRPVPSYTPPERTSTDEIRNIPTYTAPVAREPQPEASRPEQEIRVHDPGNRATQGVPERPYVRRPDAPRPKFTEIPPQGQVRGERPIRERGIRDDRAPVGSDGVRSFRETKSVSDFPREDKKHVQDNTHTRKEIPETRPLSPRAYIKPIKVHGRPGRQRAKDRNNSDDGTRQLFELWWEQGGKSDFPTFFRGHLSEYMRFYYQRKYINGANPKSASEYKQWKREWSSGRQKSVKAARPTPLRARVGG